MTHDPRDSEHEEQALLAHYREHSGAEPSAGLDARILAAARAAQAPAMAAPSWPARLQAWLFAGPVRWPVVLGSLAVFGLGLGLSLKTLERAPGRYDQAEPLARVAPAPLPVQTVAPSVVAPAAPEAQKRLGGALAEDEAFMADRAQEDAAPLAEKAMASNQAKTAPESEALTARPARPVTPLLHVDRELQAALEQVLVLRREGQAQQAQARLEALRSRYPERDLDAELLRLQSQPARE